MEGIKTKFIIGDPDERSVRRRKKVNYNINDKLKIKGNDFGHYPKPKNNLIK